MSKLSASSLLQVDFEDEVDSYPIRENFSTVQNAHNDLENRVDLLVGTTPAGNEVTDARDYAAVLRDRLRYAASMQGNHVIQGGWVTHSAAHEVQVAALTAMVNGILCDISITTTKTGITFTSGLTVTRMDIVAINSSNAIEVITGSEDVVPVMPAVSISQRPLAYLIIDNTSIITVVDCRTQGCTVRMANGNQYLSGEDTAWIFDPYEAVQTIGGFGGTIYIHPGNYFNQISFTGAHDLTIICDGGVSFFAPELGSCIATPLNSAPGDTTNILWIGGKFYDRNIGSPNQSLINLSFCSNFQMTGIVAADASYTSATNKYYTHASMGAYKIEGFFPAINTLTGSGTGFTYNGLLPFLQNVGDIMKISGEYTLSARNAFPYKAKRLNSTTIRLFYFGYTSGNVPISGYDDTTASDTLIVTCDLIW